MLQPSITPRSIGENQFGLLIFTWRGTVKRTKILAHLQGWSKDVFYRLEKGEVAPPFDQLRPLYRALWLAGVAPPPDGVQVFVKFAREKIESKRTRFDLRSDEEWAELLDDLLLIDYAFRAREIPQALTSPNPLLIDTSHLVRRDTWHEQMKQCLEGPDRKKVIVIPGPSGIGKTSELARFASQLRRANACRPILCDFREASHMPSPEEALDIFQGSVLSALGIAQPPVPAASLDERVATLLEQAEKAPIPVVMIIDHAECILSEQGKLATCWERFLIKILKYQHRSTLIIATRQWPAWFAGELHFLAEMPVSPLPIDQSVLLLQQLGLKTVSLPLLREICEKIGGIPLCLEWVAALAQQSAFPDEDELGALAMAQQGISAFVQDLTGNVRRLIAEPYIFGGSLAEEIAPLLKQLLANYHLSPEAQELLQLVSLTTVPLSKPALDVLMPQWSRITRELRRACLLVTYPDRVQALPSVAAAVVRTLSSEERNRHDERLIEAYQAWLTQGSFYENEKGVLVTELATLQLTHRQLLQASQTLIRHGWLAFGLGHTTRLARLARKVIGEWENEPGCQLGPAAKSGKWLLSYFLFAFLGEKINADERFINYQRVLGWIIDGTVTVRASTQLFIVRHLAVHLMNRGQYQEAGSLIEECEQRLTSDLAADPDLKAAALEIWGFLFTSWCEEEEKRKNLETAGALRDRAITVYRQSQNLLLQAENQATPLKKSFLKKRLARALTNLGFHLSRIEQYNAAIEVLQESVALKEQGYTEPGSLPASYGDLSQALLGAGLLAEAERYDVLAWNAIHQMAASGDTLSQENTRIYYVNRARLYIRLGRLDEAEPLLRDALNNLPERWDMYRKFAQQALNEIEHLRASAANAIQPQALLQ